MKYTQFQPPEADAEDVPTPTPTQDALILQIEADHYAAKQRGDKDAQRVLEARRKLVAAAATDASAAGAYFKHVEEINGGGEA